MVVMVVVVMLVVRGGYIVVLHVLLMAGWNSIACVMDVLDRVCVCADEVGYYFTSNSGRLVRVVVLDWVTGGEEGCYCMCNS